LSQQAQDLLTKGKQAYEKGDYKDAEDCFRKVKDGADEHSRRCALINLNVIYAEKMKDFSKSVEINEELLKMDKSAEVKTNLAESLLRTGRYDEARKYASEVVNGQAPSSKRDTAMIYPDVLDEKGYKTVNTFFILCSLLLEGNGNFKISERQWIFDGLEAAINQSNASQNTKTALLAIIKSFK
jgi:tetratricopeptide (TPR) repeat protein